MNFREKTAIALIALMPFFLAACEDEDDDGGHRRRGRPDRRGSQESADQLEEEVDEGAGETDDG